MKKKIIPFVLSISSAGILLGGCSLFGSGENNDQAPAEVSSTTNSEQENTGDVIEKDGIRKTIVYNNSAPGIEGETGPMEYSLDSIQLADVITTTDTASRMLDLEKNTDAVMITIGFTCKNIWDISSNFYISQAVIELEDGEDATPKSFYGEYTDGHFVAGASKTGSNVYVIKGKKAEEIKNIMFHVDAPADNDFQDIGEDLDVEIVID